VTAPRAAIVGVLLVVMAAAALFATRVVLARAAGTPRPVPAAGARGSALTSATSSRTPFGRPGPATAQNGTPAKVGATATAGTVTVHVVGQVRQPGVVTLATGSRVVDAVAKAGGALRTADLPALNLARVLVDGEQIRVTRPGESPVIGAPAGAAGGGGGADGGAGAAGSGGESAGSSAPGAPLNLNQATAAQLEELPGVGPVLAQRIVDWRTAHGRFATVDELGEVSGIGDKIFDELRTRVTV
jgi:competence protein ComEA